MKRKKTTTKRFSMSVYIILVLVALMTVFGTLAGILGFVSFSNALQTEYEETTYHMAYTATGLLNADNVDAYLAGEKTEEYQQTLSRMDTYCRRMHVSLLYVIKVDTSDYGNFVSVFNCVNNEVDNTEYSPWALGYRRATTNYDYRQRYRKLYQGESECETVYRPRPADGSHPHITTLVPVKNFEGEVKAILCIQRPIREQEDARKPYIITMVVSISALALIASAFIAIYIHRHVVNPIRAVGNEAVCPGEHQGANAGGDQPVPGDYQPGQVH